MFGPLTISRREIGKIETLSDEAITGGEENRDGAITGGVAASERIVTGGEGNPDEVISGRVAAADERIFPGKEGNSAGVITGGVSAGKRSYTGGEGNRGGVGRRTRARNRRDRYRRTRVRNRRDRYRRNCGCLDGLLTRLLPRLRTDQHLSMVGLLDDFQMLVQEDTEMISARQSLSFEEPQIEIVAQREGTEAVATVSSYTHNPRTECRGRGRSRATNGSSRASSLESPGKLRTSFKMVIDRPGHKSSIRVAKLDTGSKVDVMSEDVAKSLGLSIETYIGRSLQPVGPKGTALNPIGKSIINWHARGFYKTYRTEFLVLDSTCTQDFDILIGEHTIDEYNLLQDNKSVFWLR